MTWDNTEPSRSDIYHILLLIPRLTFDAVIQPGLHHLPGTIKNNLKFNRLTGDRTSGRNMENSTRGLCLETKARK
jgi:hypothetical protein